jgi:t-SNARE complex subunit (syntaxin)
VLVLSETVLVLSETVLVLSETVLVLVIESRHSIQNASSTTNGLTTIAFRSITSTSTAMLSTSTKKIQNKAMRTRVPGRPS